MSSKVQKKWLLRLLAMASILLNLVLLVLLIPEEQAAEEKRSSGARAGLASKEETTSGTKLSAGPGVTAIRPRRKIVGPAGQGRVAMPWVFAKQIVGRDAFVPYSDGHLNSSLTDLLSITPAESEMLHAESRRLLALLKKSEAERVRLVRSDSGAEFYEIPADPEFSKGIRDEMAESMIGILGSERGAILADAMVTKNPFFPNPDVRFEISIESHGEPNLIVRRFAADGRSLGGSGKPMDLNHIDIWLEPRYGHIVDFAAWKEYLNGDRSSEPEP